jgi:hypothetical protein
VRLVHARPGGSQELPNAREPGHHLGQAFIVASVALIAFTAQRAPVLGDAATAPSAPYFLGLRGAAQPAPTGRWWLHIDIADKRAYVTGYMEGAGSRYIPDSRLRSLDQYVDLLDAMARREALRDLPIASVMHCAMDDEFAPCVMTLSKAGSLAPAVPTLAPMTPYPISARLVRCLGCTRAIFVAGFVPWTSTVFGSWWNAQSQSGRLAFVSGYAAGHFDTADVFAPYDSSARAVVSMVNRVEKEPGLGDFPLAFVMLCGAYSTNEYQFDQCVEQRRAWYFSSKPDGP